MELFYNSDLTNTNGLVKDYTIHPIGNGTNKTFNSTHPPLSECIQGMIPLKFIMIAKLHWPEESENVLLK